MSLGWSSHSCDDDSMSVRKNVTTPEGNTLIGRFGANERGIVREHTSFEVGQRRPGLDPELTGQDRAPRARRRVHHPAHHTGNAR